MAKIKGPRFVYLIRIQNFPCIAYHLDELPAGAEFPSVYRGDPRKRRVIWRHVRAKSAYSTCNRLARLGLARDIEVVKYVRLRRGWCAKTYDWFPPGHKKANY
jgi:hypothetical protein